MCIYGYDFVMGKYINYFVIWDYVEVEGIVFDGKWIVVECGIKKEGEWDLLFDICWFDFVLNGRLLCLIVGMVLGGMSKVSNLVVSLDGKVIVF